MFEAGEHRRLVGEESKVDKKGVVVDFAIKIKLNEGRGVVEDGLQTFHRKGTVPQSETT